MSRVSILHLLLLFILVGFRGNTVLCEDNNKLFEEQIQSVNVLQTSSEKTHDYVDPFDMLNYDPVLKKNTKIEANLVEKQPEELSLDGDRDVGKEDDIDRDREVKSSQVDESLTKIKSPMLPSTAQDSCSGAPERIFLRRFISIIYNVLQLEDRDIHPGETLYIDLSAKVSSRHREILQSYIQGPPEGKLRVGLTDLDEVLSALLSVKEVPQSQSSYFSYEFPSFDLHPKALLIVVFLTVISAIILMVFQKFSVFSIFSCCLVTFFTVDVYWTWNRMLQEALAKRESDMIKFSKIPRDCFPDQLSAWEIFVGFFRKNDYCDQYHEILMKEPVYNISLMAAFSETLATLIFHPLEYIGNRVGSFFASLLSTQGWLDRYIILLIVIVLIVFALLLLCGYQARLPFLSLGPSQQLRTQPVQRGPEPEEIQELRREIQYLRQSSVLSSSEASRSPQQPSVVNVHIGAETLIKGKSSQEPIEEIWKAIQELRLTTAVSCRPALEESESESAGGSSPRTELAEAAAGGSRLEAVKPASIDAVIPEEEDSHSTSESSPTQIMN